MAGQACRISLFLQALPHFHGLLEHMSHAQDRDIFFLGNLAASREKAKAVIMSGNVYVDGQKEDKLREIKETSIDENSTGSPMSFGAT